MLSNLTGIALFFAVSSPSVKLLYASPFMNFIPVIIFTFVIGARLKIRNAERMLLLAFVAFGLILLLFLIREANYLDLFEVSRYAVFVVTMILVFLCADRRATTTFTIALLLWGLVIALWQLLGPIPLEKEVGQHYLTVGIPITVAMCGFLIYSLTTKKSVIKRLIAIFLSWLCLSSLLTLLGRSPFLFGIGGFILVVSVRILLSPTLSLPMKMLGLIFVILVIGLVIKNVQQLLPAFIYERMLRLFLSRVAEPRMKIVYLPALTAIQERPLIGYGTASSRRIIGIYPHNIFLEILIDGGLVMLIPFTFFIFIFTKRALTFLRSTHLDFEALFLLVIGVYLFLTWNTSFDLPTSQIALIPMVMFVTITTRNNSRRKKFGMRPTLAHV